MERDTQNRGYMKMLQACLECSEEDNERGHLCYRVTCLEFEPGYFPNCY